MTQTTKQQSKQSMKFNSLVSDAAKQKFVSKSITIYWSMTQWSVGLKNRGQEKVGNKKERALYAI
jgi:hypothetical protein